MEALKYILSSIILLVVLSGKLLAQDETSSPKNFSLGLGIDIETIYNHSIISDYYFDPSASFALTVDLFNLVRLEPEIGYNKQDHYNIYDNLQYRSSGISTGVGGYWLFHLNNVTPYVGVRFSTYKYDYIRELPSTSTYEQYVKQSNLGPILGVEYRFTKHFSLGADIGYYWFKRSNRQVDDDSDETYTEKGNFTGSRLRFRFFFL